jgi:heme-degrading monooxygenase HmoA
MYARVTIATFKPGKVDEGIKILRDSVIPAAKKQKGFKKYFALGDTATGKGMSIVMWNTEADMMAGESNEYYKGQLDKLGPFMAGPPTTERYEVMVQG